MVKDVCAQGGFAGAEGSQEGSTEKNGRYLEFDVQSPQMWHTFSIRQEEKGSGGKDWIWSGGVISG